MLDGEAADFAGPPPSWIWRWARNGDWCDGKPGLLVMRSGEEAAVQVQVTDAQGVEEAIDPRNFVTPHFDAEVDPRPDLPRTPNSKVPQPGLGPPEVPAFIASRVRFVARPVETGGAPFPAAPIKDPVRFAWADLQYRSAQTKFEWTAIPSWW